jgi:hypothetical protein
MTVVLFLLMNLSTFPIILMRFFFYSTLLKDIFKPACMLIEVESSLEQYQDNAFKIIQ